MGKRKNASGGADKSKRFKAGGFIDPGTSGIFATCNRGREQQCRKELMNLFAETAERYYGVEEADAASDQESESELSIEDQIKREVQEITEKKDTKTERLKPIDLDCECLVFIKTRRPIAPESFVERLCEELKASHTKSTRFTQRLTPITFSASASVEEIKKLALRVLKPHFHQPENQPLKYAIQVSRRNFNSIPKDDIIRAIAECVGREHGHCVDLKQYDKLILVECYKSNVGMSVVSGYLEHEKFNLQQIFEKGMEERGETEANVNRLKAKKEENERHKEEA